MSPQSTRLPGIPRISQGDAWTQTQRQDIRAIWDDLVRAINQNSSVVTGILPVNLGGTGVDNSIQTYLPVHSALVNLSATTPYTAQYFQLGQFVQVAGAFLVDAIAGAANTSFTMSLPVVAAFTDVFQLGGTAFCPAIAGMGAAIIANVADQAATVQWLSSSTASQYMSFSFGYLAGPQSGGLWALEDGSGLWELEGGGGLWEIES